MRQSLIKTSRVISFSRPDIYHAWKTLGKDANMSRNITTLIAPLTYIYKTIAPLRHFRHLKEIAPGK